MDSMSRDPRPMFGVLATVLDAVDIGYRVIVVRDADELV